MLIYIKLICLVVEQFISLNNILFYTFINEIFLFLMIKIIKDKGQWDSLLTSVDSFDFYHTFEYHHISKKDNEEPAIFSYSEENKVIAIPLLIRKIANIPYMDCTSVYGYCGPISKNIDKMKVLATEDNYCYLNLSSGVGNEKNFLFDFKSSYTKHFKLFSISRYFVNDKIYEGLVIKEKEYSQLSKQCNLFSMLPV